MNSEGRGRTLTPTKARWQALAFRLGQCLVWTLAYRSPGLVKDVGLQPYHLWICWGLIPSIPVIIALIISEIWGLRFALAHDVSMLVFVGLIISTGGDAALVLSVMLPLLLFLGEGYMIYEALRPPPKLLD